jgi:hypothetical protein
MAIPENAVPSESSEREKLPVPEMTFFSLKDVEGETNPLRDALIESYQDIFHGGPWYQYQECTDCDQSYSKDQHQRIYGQHEQGCICVVCGKGQLEDPHEYNKVWNRLKAELTHPDSFLLISGTDLPEPAVANEIVIARPSPKNQPKVAGFSWGFSTGFSDTMDYMVENYFPGTSLTDKERLSQEVANDLGQPPRAVYVSEFGVKSDHRQTSLSFDMMQQLTNKMLREGKDPYVCWTSKGTTQTAKQKEYGLSSPDNVVMAGRFRSLDAVFKTHYVEGESDKLRKVVRSIVARGNEQVAPEYRPQVKNGPPMYGMLLGLGAKPFRV